MAETAVTNAQFQAFIDDPEGYTNPKWWTDLEEDPGEVNRKSATARGRKPKKVW